MRIAILGSGEGTTFQSIQESFEVSLVISNKIGSGIIEKARQLNIPRLTLLQSEKSDHIMNVLLKSFKIDLVILTGYLQKIGPLVLETFKNRIINSHPSLLPQYGGHGMYGRKIHQAIYDNKETKTGVTVLRVTEEYDAGEILEQWPIQIIVGESVASIEERVKSVEKYLIKQVIRDWEKY